MSLELQKEGREVIYSRMAKRRINPNILYASNLRVITVQVNEAEVYFSANCQT
jgi:hypothetical protein